MAQMLSGRYVTEKGRVLTKTALVQLKGHHDRDVNLSKIESWVRAVADEGAQIVCFPELATTMYFCSQADPAYLEWAEPVDGPSVRRIAAVARETGTVVVLPMYENDRGRLFNSAVVIGPDGSVIGTYRKNSIPKVERNVDKIDPTSNEAYYFEPSDRGFPVFDTPFGVKLGILICYDRHFPEAARVLGLGGATLLLVPSATCREWIREAWEVELRAHALANGYYVGGINKVGVCEGGDPARPHFGSSVLIGPRGEVLERASRDQDQAIYCDVSPERVAHQRGISRFFAKRRPDAYGPVCDQSLVSG